MTLRRTAFAALAAAALALPGLASAQPMEHGWHHGGPGDDMEFLHGLNLTDAQKEQAHSLMKAAFAQAKLLMEQMHTLREQHITLLLTAGSTKEQLAAVLHQEESVRNELDSQRLTTALQLRSLLTPEQLAQAADLHTKLEALHEQERQTIEGARGEPE
jgi:Spy/CpxP family protein refolding chaperone